ncbi:hypothetical protein JHK86_002683 [Glycine max]|nr:hypothetical protein JHK86_002683 [Glycine max]
MALPEGVQVHGAVVKMGLEGEIFVSNSLIHFYEECGRVDLGRKMFEGMLERNAGVEPNPATMICVISAFAKLKDLELGKKV